MIWALIEVDKSREGPNEFWEGGPVSMAFSKDLNHLSDKSLQIEGRSSGSSKSAYSGLRSDLIWEKTVDGILTRMVTIEHSATGENGDFFTQRDDSGSMVFQGAGEVVGMVFAGIERRRITFFTRIDDLFKNIKNGGCRHSLFRGLIHIDQLTITLPSTIVIE